ncbi:uncharacterized protein LOC130761402 [Actinidia eriantha]|uniref:uncharacterized protein LOC130761402 n=1 Tax=Actinidia eriantha TaxID=165200 RepID=UPI002582E0E9|nr:uncharacterized protein LOC130761402 [Actinidia eriantha]
MGNVASCAPSIICSSGAVKVMLFDGRLEIYTRSVKAAELMLENPGQFICESTNLKVGHRVPGLSADEQLKPHHLYFLLPMDMLYSVLTNEDLASLAPPPSKTCTAFYNKQGSFNFRSMFPVLGDFCMFPNSDVRKTPGNYSPEEPVVAERYSRQRSWMPALETIVETPPRS